MPNSANYGWSTPVGGVAPDVPLYMESLATAVDATLYGLSGTTASPGAPQRFASASARDAVITSPVRGTVCVVDGDMQIHTGVGWISVNRPPEDTANLTAGTNWAAVGGVFPLTVYARGSLVQISTLVQFTGTTSAQFHSTITQIPVGFRPTRAVPLSPAVGGPAGGGAGAFVSQLIVGTDGNLQPLQPAYTWGSVSGTPYVPLTGWWLR